MFYIKPKWTNFDKSRKYIPRETFRVIWYLSNSKYGPLSTDYYMYISDLVKRTLIHNIYNI